MTRPFAPRDALRLRDQQASGTPLELETEVLLGHSPLRQAIVGYWPLGDDGVATLVLESPETTAASGFVQARKRLDSSCADLTYIAPSLNAANGAALAWQRLLAGACQWLGANGVQRIYAAVDENDQVGLQVFRQLGFVVYTSDLVFRHAPLLEAPDSDAVAGRLKVVPLSPALEHEVERIERQAVPESARSRDCSFGGEWSQYPLGGRSPGALVCRAVLDESGVLQSAYRLVEGRWGHWLRVVADQATEAGPAIQCAMSGATNELGFARAPIYAAARGNEPQLNLALRECGFEPVVGRFRLVKHTTARILEPAWRQRAVRDGGLDPAPTRSTQLHQAVPARNATRYPWRRC